ncbi:MAG: hypothetical protein ACFFD6_11840 [Candidatus Thorarchaeota archaeon]
MNHTASKASRHNFADSHGHIAGAAIAVVLLYMSVIRAGKAVEQKSGSVNWDLAIFLVGQDELR